MIQSSYTTSGVFCMLIPDSTAGISAAHSQTKKLGNWLLPPDHKSNVRRISNKTSMLQGIFPATWKSYI